MTFATPWALLALLLVPLVVIALVMAKRRRIRYAIRYPALDVLAGVVERERRGRWIPAALLVLALTAPPLGHGHAVHRRVRGDERRRCRAPPQGGAPAGGQPLPRPPARALPGGPGRLRQRGRDAGAADHRPRGGAPRPAPAAPQRRHGPGRRAGP